VPAAPFGEQESARSTLMTVRLMARGSLECLSSSSTASGKSFGVSVP
jgi:hypothetical protein